VEDLGQLIFVVLFILFGLISGSKKKQRPKPRPRVQTGPPPEAVQESQREPSGRVEEAVPKKGALAQELAALLEGKAVPEAAPVATLPDIDDEAQSLETLVPAGIESHRKFHERYMQEEPTESELAEPDDPTSRPCATRGASVKRADSVEEHAAHQRPYDILAGARRKKNLSRRELRHAFVMKEVLGPPKALE
jgi:hypothetical protein